MYKERKTSSKVCQQKWDEHVKNVHAEKLKNVKPSIDNSPPKAQKHLENRRKRDQINEDRLATIERDNLILLDKMMDIIKKPSTIDNRSPSPSKSLNREARKKEIERINEDNQIILRKLTTAKPYYDRKDWENFQASQETYLENICEYPVVKNQPKSTTPLPQVRSATSRSTNKSSTTSTTTTRSSSPSSSTPKKKPTSRIKKTSNKEEKEEKEEKFSSDDSLSLSDLDSASDEEFLKGIAKLETNDKKEETEMKKEKHDGSDSDLGSEFSDSFENESDQDEKLDKHALSKSENGKVDSPKSSSSKPTSARSAKGEQDSPKSRNSNPTSARSKGPSSAKSTKSTGSTKEMKKTKENNEENFDNEFEEEKN